MFSTVQPSKTGIIGPEFSSESQTFIFIYGVLLVGLTLIYPSASRASSACADSSPTEGFKLCGHRLRDSDISQLVMVDGANLECARCPRRYAEKHTYLPKKWETAASAASAVLSSEKEGGLRPGITSEKDILS